MTNLLTESPSTIRILIAEDDADDRLLIQDALEANDISTSQTLYVENGVELISDLTSDTELPLLILLDLNMPKKDGRETLKELKNTEQFKHIPVIIFTTSKSQDDIVSSYRQGCSTYMTKPASFSELIDTMSIIKKYWLEKAALVV